MRTASIPELKSCVVPLYLDPAKIEAAGLVGLCVSHGISRRYLADTCESVALYLGWKRTADEINVELDEPSEFRDMPHECVWQLVRLEVIGEVVDGA